MASLSFSSRIMRWAIFLPMPGAALAVLGYSGSEVAAALKGIDMDALPLEEIIRQALKRMVK